MPVNIRHPKPSPSRLGCFFKVDELIMTYALLLQFILSVHSPDCSWSSQPECSLKFKGVGCFKDKKDQRAFPELLLTARDRNSAVYFGEKINWKDWANFIDRYR